MAKKSMKFKLNKEDLKKERIPLPQQKEEVLRDRRKRRQERGKAKSSFWENYNDR